MMFVKKGCFLLYAMKKLIIILIVATFYMACKPAEFSRTHRVQMKEVYIYTFKITYFKKILLAGFDDKDFQRVLSGDNSGFGEIILSMEDYNFLDSIVRLDKMKMIEDSTARVGRVAEGADGKRVLDYALLKYESKWLDHIARDKCRPFMARYLAATVIKK